MATTQVTVRGTVKPDGSLELDETVGLPPGHVQVVVTPEGSEPAEDWWQYLRRCRAERESSDAPFRRPEEIDETLEQVRGENDRINAVYWEAEWQKHHGESPEC